MTRAPRWLAALGRPLTALQRRHVDAILAACPLVVRGEVAVAGDWSVVAAAMSASAADDGWWDWEEGERAALWSRACLRQVEDDLAARLAMAREVFDAGIADALRRALPKDPSATLARGVAAELSLAVHHHALAVASGVARTHPFHRKFRLVAEGRLPLGYHGGRFLIY